MNKTNPPAMSSKPSLFEAIRYKLWWGLESNCLKAGHALESLSSPVHVANATINAASDEDVAAVKQRLRARHRRGYVGSPIAFVVATGEKPVIHHCADGRSVGMKFETAPANEGEPICVSLYLTGSGNHAQEGQYILWPGESRAENEEVAILFGGNGHSTGEEWYENALKEHNKIAAGKVQVGKTWPNRDVK